MGKKMDNIEFFMFKPDAVENGLVGASLQRIEDAGLRVVAMKVINVSKEQAEELYSPHKGKDFYESLTEYIRSGPVIVSVLAGKNAVKTTRDLMGAPNPLEAKPGTIRGDFAESIIQNVVHGGDSPENARRELKIFFDVDELPLEL